MPLARHEVVICPRCGPPELSPEIRETRLGVDELLDGLGLTLFWCYHSGFLR